MLPSVAHDELRRRIVLVVEDEILVRVTISEHLRDEGFAVIEAANASEAVAVFASGVPVDLVFTDWQMPGDMDGIMLARWVGQHHPLVGVLVTSGYASIAHAAKSIPRGAYLRKPYAPDHVTGQIRILLAMTDDAPDTA